jgi:hypothetical protein
MFGLLKSEKKNILEKELDRLRIRRSDVYGGRTEIPEYDEIYSVILDDFIAEKVIPYLNSKQYKSYAKEPRAQAEALKEKLREFKKIATKSIRGENANRIMQKRYGFNPVSMLKYNRLKPLYRERAMDRYLELYEEPENEKGYDYNILYELGLASQRAFEGEVAETDPNPIN